MAAISDLINRIDNRELRERIAQEVDRMNRQKLFGLPREILGFRIAPFITHMDIQSLTPSK